MSRVRARRFNIAFTVKIAAAIVLAVAFAALAVVTADPQDLRADIRPGDDFYGYANGAWLKTTALPEGRSRDDTTAMLRDEAARRVRDLIENAAKTKTTGRARRVGDYYASWMDVAGIEAKGMKPLLGELAAIAAIQDRRALATWLGRTLRTDDGSNSATDGLFGVWIHQGFHDPDHYAVHLVQGGLGLAERDDYLDASAAKAAVRERYSAHIAQVLKLAGFDRTADLVTLANRRLLEAGPRLT